MRRFATAFAVFLIAGCSSAALATPVTHTLTGTITFRGQNASGPCSGWDLWGTGDLQMGMQATLTDEVGKTIGTSRLEDVSEPWTRTSARVCTGAFSFADVPDAAFYQVRLGARSSEQNSKADLEASGWKLDLLIQ